MALLRRAAVNFQAQPSSQALLSVALDDEKCFHDAFLKMIDAKKKASASWYKWAKTEEENVPIKELFIKMAELDCLWIQSFRECSNDFDSYRAIFKEILHGDKAVSDSDKTVQDLTRKMEKLQKQINKCDAKRKSELTFEFAKLGSVLLTSQHELDEQRLNHDTFKYKMVRDAVRMMSNADIQLHERCYDIAQTQRLLLDFYTATTYSSITDAVVKTAKSNGTKLVRDLEKKLGFHDTHQTSEQEDNMPQVSPGNDYVDEEELAEYTPIPEFSPSDEMPPTAVFRPLPALPPNAPNEETAEFDEYRPKPLNPYLSMLDSQANQNDSVPSSPPLLRKSSQAARKRSTYENTIVRNPSQYENSASVRDIMRVTSSHNQSPVNSGSEPAPPPIPARRRAAAAAESTTARTEQADYLQVMADNELRVNSLYIASEDDSEQSEEYLHLQEAYSHKQSSRADQQSVVTSSANVNGTASYLSPDDDNVYDFVGDDDVHMRICDVVRSTQTAAGNTSASTDTGNQPVYDNNDIVYEL